MVMHKFAFILGVGIFLAGCTQVQIASHIWKKSTGLGGPPCAQGQKGEPKIGNPYTVNGITYRPLKSSAGYKNKGIASWYGSDFHGRTTANGECYDMYALTAAHPTLPLPTTVRVTNLENNRSVILRVNDRGPFARGREIDLSYRAALELGMVNQGTAPVLVEAIGGHFHGRQSTQYVQAASTSVTQPYQPKPSTQRMQYTQPRAETNNIPPPPEPSTVPESSPMLLHEVDIFVQVGAYSNKLNAERQRLLLSELEPSAIVWIDETDSRQLHRVRSGPYSSTQIADQVLAKLVRSGFNTAVLVIQDK